MTHLDKHFFYDTWKPGGLGAPPARHLISQLKSFETFEKVWYHGPFESVIIFSNIWKIKKFF